MLTLRSTAVLLLILPLAAQDEAPHRTVRLEGRAQVIPLHRQTADPAFPGDAWWAAGRDYKARLGADRVEVTPYLGDRVPTNRTLTWRTTAVLLGTERIACSSEDPARPAGSHRFLVDRGPVTEAWEVRPEGVEQTFTIGRRPATADAFTVHGRLHGLSLHPATSRGEGHQPIRWHDDDTGDAVLSYGAAAAVDASGRSWPLTTHWRLAGPHELQVELRVPPAVVAAATYPLTIDPLLGTGRLGFLVEGKITSHAIAPGPVSTLTVEERPASASDTDLFVKLWRFVSGQGYRVFPVYSDLASSYDSVEADAVHVEGSQRYAVGFVRRSTTFSRVRVSLVDDSATGFGQGDFVLLDEFVPGSLDANPTLSGARSIGVTLQLAAEVSAPVGSTGRSPQIHGVWINSRTATVNRAPFLMAAPTPFTTRLHQPSTLPARDDGEDQFLTLHSRRDTAGFTEVRLIRQRFDGTVQNLGRLAISGDDRDFQSNLRIAGGDGEYMASWHDLRRVPSAPSSPTRVGSTLVRFRLRTGDPAPVALRTERFRVGTFPGAPLAPLLGDLAYDDRTGSHWVAAFDTGSGNTDAGLRIVRFGWDGKVTEVLTPDLPLSGSPTGARSSAGPFVARSVGQNFSLAYQVRPGGPPPIVEETFLETYAVTPGISASYLAGCGGGTLDTVNFPESGSRFFGFELTGAPPAKPTSLLISFLAANVPLDPIGATGCVVGLDPTLTIAEPTAPTSTAGSTSYQLPIPEEIEGRLFAQWIVLDPDAPGGLVLSNAQRVIIR